MTEGPPRRRAINVAFGQHWEIIRPFVYRMLPKVHVDEFFADGSLRLSSFASFQKHPDELRRDQEGRHLLRETRGNIVDFAVIEVAGDAYVLCGSTSHTEDMRAKYPTADSVLVIEDTVEFSSAIAKQIPYFAGGAEGLCQYDHSPRRELIEDPATGTLKSHLTTEAYFWKGPDFAHELEYRL